MDTMTKPKNKIDETPQKSHILLHSLRLSNFLSFGPDAPEISLGPLNILIGPNGSGKSNLIEAITLLRACPVRPVQRGSGSIQSIMSAGGGTDEWIGKDSPKEPATLDVVIKNQKRIMPLRHVLTFVSELQRFRVYDESVEDETTYIGEDTPYYYYKYQQGQPSAAYFDHADDLVEVSPVILDPKTIEPDASILAQRDDPYWYLQISYLVEQYSKIAIYRDWTFGRSTVYRQPQKADGRVDRLEEDFSNLGVFLNRLYGISKTKRVLLESLRELYDGVDDFHVDIFAGNVQIVFNEGDKRIPATRLSDGTLRYLCLLAILCDPTPPPLICIEEPELGLHPDIMPKIADLLVEASTRTQLIVTTHSEILVDAMTKYPEAIVVLEKREGQTEIKRVPPLALDDRLGALWMEGEIGGTRW